MTRGLTLRDLLFWATIECKDARDERARAIWKLVVRRIEDCVRTYHGKEGCDGPRRPDARRI